MIYLDVKVESKLRDDHLLHAFRLEFCVEDAQLPSLLHVLNHRRMTIRERTFKGMPCRAVSTVVSRGDIAEVLVQLKALGCTVNVSKVDGSFLGDLGPGFESRVGGLGRGFDE